jgi:hypothetical protein
MNKALTVITQILALTSPFWLPILAGYCIFAYAKFFKHPLGGKVEEAIFYLALVSSFLIGNFVISLKARGSVGGMLISIIVYSLVAVFVLFLSGWGFLLILRYGI